MTPEVVAALIAIGSYAALRAVDRLFRIIDHWLNERLDDDKETDDEP